MSDIRTYTLNNLPKSQTNSERVKNMTEEEIYQNALSDPDAQPLTDEELSQFRRVHPPKNINVKKIRENLHLSQGAFAAFFGVNKRTLQHWEQGRTKPRGPARTLLSVIASDPKAVQKALWNFHA